MRSFNIHPRKSPFKFFSFSRPSVSLKQVHAGTTWISNDMMDLNEKLIFFFSSWSRREEWDISRSTGCGPGGEKDASCSRPRWGSSHSGTEQVPFSLVPVKPGQENQRVQWAQLHPQTVSFKTSAPWIRHLIYSMVPLLQLCHAALYLSPSLAQPAGLTPVPWIPLPVPSPGARGRFFDGLQLPVWFSKKKQPTKIQRTFWS